MPGFRLLTSRRLRWALLGLGLLAAAWGIAVAAKWRTTSAVERARRAAAAGQLSRAMMLYEEHLRRHPGDQSARLALGEICHATDPERAIEVLAQVPEGAAEYVSAQRRMAAVAIDAGDDRRAEQALTVLLETLPDDYAVRLSLAELYHRQRSPKAALPHAVRCAALKPDRAETWLLLSEIYDDLHRTHEMIAPLRRAVLLAPDLVEAHLNLCYALLWSGEFEESRREAEWCLARDPDDIVARRLLAQCERDEGRPERALGEIRRALRVAPDDLECRLVEGQLLLYLRQADEAFRRLEPLVARYPRNRRLLNLAVRAARASGRPEAAAEIQSVEHSAGYDSKRPQTDDEADSNN
jgi:predicted Zn-dependent protease